MLDFGITTETTIEASMLMLAGDISIHPTAALAHENGDYIAEKWLKKQFHAGRVRFLSDLYASIL